MKWLSEGIVLMSSILLVIDGYFVSDMLQDSISSLKSSNSDAILYQHYCDGCKIGVSILQNPLGIRDERMLEMLKELCTSMNISTSAVCDSAVELFGGPTLKIAKKSDMTPKEVCSFIFDCGEIETPLHQWNISLPAIPKPKLQTHGLPKENVPRLKVLHIADTHYDPLYVEGSNADCSEPLCCRHFNEFSNSSFNASFSAAGKWGSYQCDLPRSTLEHLLDHISQAHKDIDYVIWTGDLVPHDIWNQTNEEITAIVEEHIQLISDKLPGVTIYPSLGNHERAPANFFPSFELDVMVSMLYDDLDALWSRWLPENTSPTLRYGAYYSTLVRPGFRVISINTNVCNNLNIWLLLNSTDPLMELEWLINELQSAENAEEKVHIIGHIPPGYIDCVKTWSHNYYEIIARYESTVTAQFFAHTHFDEFEVFYDSKNLTRATNIAYIGPSVTPYENLNPAYRIYYVDGDHDETTRFVVDHETWSMDLEEANDVGTPVWRKLYTAKDAYSLPALRPADWSDFIMRMKNDDELFDLYYRNYWRDSPKRQLCSSTCKEDILCQAKSGRSRDKSNLCQDLNPTEEKIDDTPEFQNSNIDNSPVENGQIAHLLHKGLFVIFIWNVAQV